MFSPQWVKQYQYCSSIRIVLALNDKRIFCMPLNKETKPNQ